MSFRALHFVFKVSDRKQTLHFFRDVLGMKVLRHEEFKEGCQAACNGPYDGQWSKTMIGYGPEDNHFVIELTYNYGIGNYEMGNDFQGITIHCKQAFENIRKYNWPVIQSTEGHVVIHAPDGYPFTLVNKEANGDPVKKVSLAVSHLDQSKAYWQDKLKMSVEHKTDESLLLYYAKDQCHLELLSIGKPVNHAKAFGRIAFSCPKDQLPSIEEKMKAANEKILTPLISLDTPGKATVQVVILADPDGHEICFVGDEAFRELSQPDPRAEQLLDESIANDRSSEWFNKRGGKLSA